MNSVGKGGGTMRLRWSCKHLMTLEPLRNQYATDYVKSLVAVETPLEQLQELAHVNNRGQEEFLYT